MIVSFSNFGSNLMGTLVVRKKLMKTKTQPIILVLFLFDTQLFETLK